MVDSEKLIKTGYIRDIKEYIFVYVTMASAA